MAGGGDPSSSEFNEIEFKEYNPTPYKGGYDIAQTYGKPLPPSDAICYPRSSLDREIIPGDPDRIVQVSAAAAAGDEYEQEGDPGEKILGDGRGDKEEEDQRSFYEGEGNWASAGVPVRCCDLGWGNIFSYDDRGYEHFKGEPIEGGRYEICHGEDRGSGSDSGSYQPSSYGLPDPRLDIMSYMDVFGDLCNGGLVQNGTYYSNDQVLQDPWKETVDYLFGNSNSFEETHYDPACYEQYTDFFQHASSWNHQSNHYKFHPQSHRHEAYVHKN